MKKTYPYTPFNPSSKYFLQQIPVGSRIFESGPVSGYMTEFLKKERNCKVACIELNPQMAEIASRYAQKKTFGSLLLFHRKYDHIYQFICKGCRSSTNSPSFRFHDYRYSLWKLPVLVYFDIKDFLRIRYNIHFHLLPQKSNGN